MAGQPTGERQDGIPIADAAALLGLSAEAVRKRIQRGTLDGHKRGGHWFVVIERPDAPSGRQDAVRTGRQDTTDGRQDAPPVEAAYHVTPVEIEQAVSRTSAQYMGDLRTMLAEVGKVYEGQLAAKDEALAAQAQTIAAQTDTIGTQREALATQAERVAEQQAAIAELRRRAEIAEGERDRLATAQAAPGAPGAPEVVSPDNPTPEASAGVWARLRRVFGRGA